MRFLFLLLFPSIALGFSKVGNVYTTDGSDADVIAAHADATVGDIIDIPSGEHHWDQRVTLDKGITLRGAGVGITMLYDDMTIDDQAILIDTPFGANLRITGIEFLIGTVPGTVDPWIYWSGSSRTTRVDHCKFQNTTRRAFFIAGLGSEPKGVVDNCEFVGAQQAAYIRNNLITSGATQYGDWGWENAVPWGGDRMLFFEDCDFTDTSIVHGALDGDGGSWACIRYCNFENKRITWHGAESSQRYRGGCAYEVYNCTFSTPGDSGANQEAIDLRAGSVVSHDNDFGDWDYAYGLNNYRNYDSFMPWGFADGTKLWDVSDLTDGAGTPGGAGDGVFESGTSTASGTLSLTDSGKSWTTNQWAGYVVRWIRYSGTVASTGTNTIDVSPDPGWATNIWSSPDLMEITNLTNGQKGRVASNDSNTVTMSVTTPPTVAFSAGHTFEITMAMYIASNTATVLTGKGGALNWTNHDPGTGVAYVIRNISAALDQNGMGTSSQMSGSATSRPQHQNINQVVGGNPSYEWNNTGSLNPSTPARTATLSCKIGRDFVINTAKPGYTPYTYPHPLRNEVGGSAVNRGKKKGQGRKLQLTE